MSRPDAPVRHLRALVAAGAATGLGAVAHGTGMGHVPAPTPLLLGFLVLYLLGAAFGRRERGLIALASFVGVGQAGLHLGFASAHMHGGGQPLVGGTRMLALHVVAALLLAWWLRRGEDLAWTLLVRLAGRRPTFADPTAVTARPLPVVWPAPRVLAARALLLPVGRRGPPVTC